MEVNFDLLRMLMQTAISELHAFCGIILLDVTLTSKKHRLYNSEINLLKLLEDFDATTMPHLWFGSLRI